MDHDHHGNSALTLAVCAGHDMIIEDLHARGFALDHFNNEGRTPFWYAAKRGSREAIRLLDKFGAGVDLKDNLGVSPPS